MASSGGLHYAAAAMRPAGAPILTTPIPVGSVGFPVEQGASMGVINAAPQQVARSVIGVGSIMNLHGATHANPQSVDYPTQPTSCIAGPSSSSSSAMPVSSVGHGSTASGSAVAPDVSRLSMVCNEDAPPQETSAASANVVSKKASGSDVPDEAQILQQELESLRRSVASQEDHIAQLKQDVDISRASEEKAKLEAEALRHELVRVGEELRQEREWRAQAEISTVVSMATPCASADAKTTLARGLTKGKHRSNSSGDLHRGPSLLGVKSDAPTCDVTVSAGHVVEQAKNCRSEKAAQASVSDVRPWSKGQRMPGLATQRDDIDLRLTEFLERSDTGLSFRRLNRGWYAFRHVDDRSPPSSDRGVEVSIVNGKLMARLEPTTHEKGWNNGKLGAIERFCAHFAHVDGS